MHPQKPRWSAQNRALIPSWWAKITILRAKKVGYLKIYLCSMNLHEPFFSTSWEIDRNIYIYIHLSHQCFFWGADHSFAWLDTVIYGYPQCKHSPSNHTTLGRSWRCSGYKKHCWHFLVMPCSSYIASDQHVLTTMTNPFFSFLGRISVINKNN